MSDCFLERDEDEECLIHVGDARIETRHGG